MTNGHDSSTMTFTTHVTYVDMAWFIAGVLKANILVLDVDIDLAKGLSITS